MVDCAASHDLKVLGELLALRLGVVEAVGETHAIDRILRNTVDLARWCDADRLIDRRHNVIAVMELWPRRIVVLYFCRPRNGHGLARTAEMRRDQFGGLVRRAAGPSPSGMIHVLGLRRAEHVRAPEFVQRLDVLLDVLGMPFCESNSEMVPF